MQYKFDAFISYSRKDELFVQKLQQKLERSFRQTPKQFRKGKPTFDVLRDVTDLDITPNLFDEIKEKIKSSKYLIVICSPNAVNSKWVSKEIEAFRQSHPQKHPNEFIIPIFLSDLGKGPEGAIPHSLKVNHEWPLCIEFRAEIIEKQQSFDRYFKTEGINRIYATLLDVPYREFADRHRKHQQRLRTRIISVTSALSILFATIAVIAIFQRNRAIEQSRIANSRRLAVLSDNQINIDLQQGILLGIEAYEQYPTFEARNSLWNINKRYPGLSTSHYFPGKRTYEVIGISDTSCIVLADSGLYMAHARPDFQPVRFPGSQRVDGVGLAYHEMNSLIVSNGTHENQLFLWDLNTLELVDSIVSPWNENHFEFSFSNEGKYLAAATSRGQVVIWNMQNVTVRDTFSLTQLDDYPVIPDAMIFHQQQPLLLTSYYNGVICRDVETKKDIWIQSLHEGEVTKMTYSNGTVITADTKGIVKTWKWHADSLELLSAQKVHEAGIQDMGINASGNLLFTIGVLDKTAKFWQLPEWRLQDSLYFTNASFYSCSWLANKDQIAVSEYEKVSFWEPISTIKHKISWPDFQTEKPFWWSSDGQKIGYIDDSANVVLLSLDPDNFQLELLKTYKMEGMQYAQSTDELLRALNEIGSPFAFNASLDVMAIQKDSLTIQTIAWPENHLISETSIDKGTRITELTISQSGQKLAYILDREVIHVIDVQNNQHIKKLDQFKDNGIGNINFINDDEISFIAWNPVVWNIETNEIEELILESERNASSFTVAPGSQFAFSGYLFQDDILMWDLMANEPMKVSLGGYSGNELRFDHKRNILLEFDLQSSSIIERRIDLSSHHSNALRMANRSFTPVERRQFGLTKD